MGRRGEGWGRTRRIGVRPRRRGGGHGPDRVGIGAAGRRAGLGSSSSVGRGAGRRQQGAHRKAGGALARIVCACSRRPHRPLADRRRTRRGCDTGPRGALGAMHPATLKQPVQRRVQPLTIAHTVVSEIRIFVATRYSIWSCPIIPTVAPPPLFAVQVRGHQQLLLSFCLRRGCAQDASSELSSVAIARLRAPRALRGAD